MDIKNLFAYDESSPTGLISISKRCRCAVGAPAGCVRNNGYYYVGVGYKRLACHRIVWELFNGPIPDGMQIDHVNMNRKDNRISNLRLATRSQNHANKNQPEGGTSKYKGVSFDKSRGKWISMLKVKQKQINLGRYDDQETAALAYDYGAKFHFGEFAKLNFSNPIEELRK